MTPVVGVRAMEMGGAQTERLLISTQSQGSCTRLLSTEPLMLLSGSFVTWKEGTSQGMGDHQRVQLGVNESPAKCWGLLTPKVCAVSIPGNQGESVDRSETVLGTYRGPNPRQPCSLPLAPAFPLFCLHPFPFSV